MRHALRALFFCLLLSLNQTVRAQTADCDCSPSLRHLCRCGVLIEQDVAELQLSYLNRLLKAEFSDYLKDSPVTAVKLAPAERMILRGEAAQGYFDNGKIVLNNSLRRDQALMVLAHELGHAWHFSEQPDPDEISDFLAEGFAEWVSYSLMRRAGLTEFCFNLKNNSDPLYGKACRWFLELENNHGRPALINIMRNWLNEDGKQRPGVSTGLSFRSVPFSKATTLTM